MNGIPQGVMAQAAGGGMSPEQHLVFAYIVALGLLAAYAVRLWAAHAAFRRRDSRRDDGA